jgi:serine/threonine protein phosphatase 1
MPKTWVIPDIHGYKNTLLALLNDYINPNKQDVLYFLGDLIDRGPDSKGVLDYLMGMQERGYKVTVLRGNHEQSMLNVRKAELQRRRIMGFKFPNQEKKAWYMFGGRETMKSFDEGNILSIDSKYFNWIDQLPYYVELEKYILVHAGINCEAEKPFEDNYSMMWIRNYEILPERVRFKKIIHGHVPVDLAFMYSTLEQPGFDFIALDNGVYMSDRLSFGNLVALELNSMDLMTQPNID